MCVCVGVWGVWVCGCGGVCVWVGVWGVCVNERGIKQSNCKLSLVTDVDSPSSISWLYCGI